jgi:predicted PurR-regulated permease PerM
MNPKDTASHEQLEAKNHGQKTVERIETHTVHVRSDPWLRTAAAGAIAIAGGLAIVAFFWLLARPLALLGLAIAVAAALDPEVELLARKLPRALAVVIVYLVVLGIFSVIGWIIFPPLISQFQQVIANLPTIIQDAQTWFSHFGQISFNSLINMLTSQLGSASSSLIQLPIGIINSLFEILVVFFVSLYGLIQAPSIGRFIISLFPHERGQRIEDVMRHMGRAMGGYIRGALINGAIIGVLMYLGLLVLGVHYPLVLGLLAGVFELIPVLGPIFAGIIIIMVALSQSFTLALYVLIYAIAMEQLEGHILVPNIMRTQTDVSPTVTILALFAGGVLGGLLGALVAIPVAAAVHVLVLEVIAPAVRRRTGAPDADEQEDQEGPQGEQDEDSQGDSRDKSKESREQQQKASQET